MNVVEADSSHVAYLSTFGRQSFLHAYQCTLPLDELKKYVDVAFSETAILEELDNPLVSYFIFQDADLKPCGYVKLIQTPAPECINSDSSIELQRLYVDSDYRGHGVGKRLALHVESYAKERSINDIWLRVWEGNVVAQDIYRKWGFSVVGDEMYQVGDEQRVVLLMSKSLPRR